VPSEHLSYALGVAPIGGCKVTKQTTTKLPSKLPQNYQIIWWFGQKVLELNTGINW
jgi:hypothetical protein